MARGKKQNSIGEILNQCADIKAERREIYGSAHITHGSILTSLFPDGLPLANPENMVRFGLINAIVGKLNRYVQNFDKGGHEDSTIDMINFCAMLIEYDRIQDENR